MRKILLSLAALAMSASMAFAQDASFISGVTFSAPGQEVIDEEENIYELPTPEVTITMEFKDFNATEMSNLGYEPKLMVATGMGFGVDPALYELDATDSPSVFKVTMDEEKWGQPYMGMLNAVCMVCFMDEDMDFYATEDGDPVFFQAIYSAPNTFPTKLVSVYPNNDWSEESFAQAYDNGVIRFNYSNVVDFDTENAIGMILYTLTDDDADPVLIELGNNAEADWNPMDGYYTLAVDYALAGVPANKVDVISVTIFEAESLGETVESVTVDLENNNPNVKRVAKKVPATKGLAVSDEAVSVYNVAGMLVKENIALSEVSTLPKGLYIVNGKKVVVK